MVFGLVIMAWGVVGLGVQDSGRRASCSCNIDELDGCEDMHSATPPKDYLKQSGQNQPKQHTTYEPLS